MKRGFSLASTIVIALLLIGLGMMIQFRFAVVGGRVLSDITWLQSLKSSSPSSVSSATISPDDIDLTQFWEVWSLLQQDYLEPDKLVTQDMVDGATKGLAAALGDAYTMYLPPKENKRSGEDLAGSFSGVGIELGYKDGVLAVVAPLPDSPADQAGVEAGDLILNVKDEARDFDESTDGWSLEKAIDEIRGPKGSTVTLTLYRVGEENAQPFTVDLVRDDVVVKTTDLTFVPSGKGGDIAHIYLGRFGGHTEDEWNDMVTQITSHTPAVQGIVLDMRNNPGGFFDGAISIASDFVDGGKVVSQQGRYSTQDFMARGEARLKNYPVAVLVNKGSASAAEIVAGALRDRIQAQLVGEKTFGKGTVQDRRELRNGGGLHVTIARWLLPGGSSINHEGLEVDVQAKDDPQTPDVDEALQAAISTVLSQSQR